MSVEKQQKRTDEAQSLVDAFIRADFRNAGLRAKSAGFTRAQINEILSQALDNAGLKEEQQ